MKINPKNNYINLEENDLDKPIYRVMSFNRFLDVFQNKNLTLVQTKKWDDPFENYLLQGKYRLGRIKFNIGYREKYYGQCWTLNEESDAMWRIYSPNKDGIKLKTTIRKLFNSLFTTRHNQNCNDRECFIGKVSYGSEQELSQAFQTLKDLNEDDLIRVFTDPTNGFQTTSLYMKRNAFKHEDEIRIVFYDMQDEQVRSDVRADMFHYNINPESLFEEIVYDPRLSEDIYKSQSDFLRTQLECHIPIKHSTLYRPPSFD